MRTGPSGSLGAEVGPPSYHLPQIGFFVERNARRDKDVQP